MDGRTGTVIFTVYHIFFAFSIRKSLQGEKTGYARKKKSHFGSCNCPGFMYNKGRLSGG